jgi:hypothetical protein
VVGCSRLVLGWALAAAVGEEMVKPLVKNEVKNVSRLITRSTCQLTSSCHPPTLWRGGATLWRQILLVLVLSTGAFTVASGLATLFFVPGSPWNTNFLTEDKQ